MPLVEVTLARGRSPEQLRTLLHEVHAAVVRSVGAPDAAVRIVIREVPPTHFSAGGVTLAERQASSGDGAHGSGPADGPATGARE
jgi:4-oxalocrotonate tautomerase